MGGPSHMREVPRGRVSERKMSGGRGSWRKRARIKRQLAAVERECWLCLEPLDFSVTDHRDPEYVVIDEELPVSKGGDPLDVRNCHLAHARCNGRKGSKVLKRGAFARHRGNGSPRTSREW